MTKIKDYQVTVKTENFNGILTNENSLDLVIEKLDSLNKNDINLNNVENTSDIDKPLSTASINALSLKEDKNNKGVANGYASLDNTGKVPQNQLPSYVDDVLEFNNFSSLPLNGESGKIYITLNDNKTYRWSGTTYVVLADTGVTSLNGNGGDITLKTINGNSLIGSGDIIISSGSVSPLILNSTNLLTDDGIGLNTLTNQGNTGIGYNTFSSSSIGTNNTAVGTNSVKSGSNNTGIGTNSLKNNTGNGNTALGTDSLQGNINNNNTGIGFTSLYNNWQGSHNTAVGFESGWRNDSGGYNSYLGVFSGRWNISGSYNTGIGSYALYNNSNSYNVAIGHQSLFNATNSACNNSIGVDSSFSNTTGNNNVVNGYQSLYSNTTGSGNVAIGVTSLYSSVTGTENTSIGYQSLYNNKSNSNTAVGSKSLKANTTGGSNTALGFECLLYNTTASYNTSVGNSSLRSNTTGTDNSAFGYSSLNANVTGIYNSAFGSLSLRYNTGNHNSALGGNSLVSNTTGYRNTALGFNSLSNNTTFFNCSGLGYNSQITADNQVQLGDSATTTYVYGTVQNRSDKRDKIEIKDTSLGLDFINKVRPVEYKWNYREKYFDEIEEIIIEEKETEEQKYIIELIDEDYIDGDEIKTKKIENKVFQYENTEEVIKFIDKDENGEKFINTKINIRQIPIMVKKIEKIEKKVLKKVEVVNDGSKAGKRFHQGVIAQEIKELIDLYGYDFGGFQDHSINGGKEVMSIGYDEFISPLIKAVQELSKEIEILKNK